MLGTMKNTPLRKVDEIDDLLPEKYYDCTN